jgi:hypothetical protein
MTDAICDEAERADRADRVLLPESTGKALVAAQEIEETMLLFADHMRYPQARPNKDGQHVVVMMNYLPDLPDTLAYHYARMGWRHHPEKAMVKQRPIVGGMFDDLVAYVDPSEPDTPIVVQPDMQTVSDTKLWSVKPRVNVIDEERPADD